MKKALNILIILSLLATPCLVVQAYQTRGYFAIGGEWLLILVSLLLIAVSRQFVSLYKECFKVEKAPTDCSQ